MIRIARREDIAAIASQVSAEGARELTEVYGATPLQAVTHNFEQSEGHRWTILSGDIHLAMFGVRPISILGGIGELYVVGTTHICTHRVAFAKACARAVPAMLSVWRELRGVLEDRPDILLWADWLKVKRQPIGDRLQLFVLSEPS